MTKAESVPRTRGDEPIPRTEFEAVIGRLFPARAGMNRLRDDRERLWMPVPRTRGDEP